ncbi:TVP38/TMEM64 family protein [Kordiimonas lacus]|uniref:TVP38/TMEM64 family membrane protein n=1 Tax=Kordiimonas lacus TaxID=637679 RepID=A0A1G7E3H5_9PROT|nr:VTT domain-containing protein [Kordiimonas lacus]SDE58274.1 Uncharacterized membrane protein YdjX, TVP38/TMEM64 family, SNARE-associated domain [Kordiimonas lacus]
MAALVKIFLILALGFASTFIVLNAAGVLTTTQIEAWLTTASSLSPGLVALIIAALLFADLFIAMPTLTLCLLAGYFLGFGMGSLATITGLTLAGICGHGLSRHYGDRLLRRIARSEQQISEAKSMFQTHGFLMILIARAMPIIPEVSACLSGITRMRFSRFLAAWWLGSVPYCLIAAYAGSVSTVDNPMPAVYTALTLSGTLWTVWFYFYRRVWAKI